MNKIVKAALTNALATAAYVVGVATLMNYLSSLMRGKEDTVFAPIAMLMLLVCSAGITGFLVVGRPVLMYLDGKKKDALSLLGYTFCFLLLLTAAALVLLVSF